MVARRHGKILAGTFNVQKGAVLYGRYWGTFEDVRHLHFNVCYYAAIAHCLEHGFTRFEPGAGGEFKHLRGFDAHPTLSMHFLGDPRLADAVRHYLIDERQAVAREIGWLDTQSALRRDSSA
jgi:predicted N-acyltransferase